MSASSANRNQNTVMENFFELLTCFCWDLDVLGATVADHFQISGLFVDSLAFDREKTAFQKHLEEFPPDRIGP